MLEFIINNLSTIMVLIIVLAVLGIVISRLIIAKKNHKSSCSCGCSGCPNKNYCHEKQK